MHLKSYQACLQHCQGMVGRVGRGDIKKEQSVDRAAYYEQPAAHLLNPPALPLATPNPAGHPRQGREPRARHGEGSSRALHTSFTPNRAPASAAAPVGMSSYAWAKAVAARIPQGLGEEGLGEGGI
jgi:hypothetical protein